MDIGFSNHNKLIYISLANIIHIIFFGVFWENFAMRLYTLKI